MPCKRAKDLVYLYDLLRREALRQELVDGLPVLSSAYAEPFAAAGEYLRNATSDGQLLGEVARQVIEASGFSIEDHTPVRAKVRATLRRFVLDAWGDG